MTPIEIIHLFSYNGPNLYGPDPGVLLRVRSDRDRSRRLRNALKDGAQFIGMVLARLEVNTRPAQANLLIEASFSTAEPAVGAALARYVVEGIRAEALGDQEWDRDGPLYDLQQQRRRVALPVAALQLIAEARARRLPVVHRPDGMLQFGYGVRGWVCDPRAQPLPAPPWEKPGPIPLIAVTGAARRAELVSAAAAELTAQGLQVVTRDEADFAATVALLADPASQALVLGLDTADILRRGLAFERCTRALVAHLGEQRPPEALDDDEWARAAALPMLLADETACLDLHDPRLQALAPYAPHGMRAL